MWREVVKLVADMGRITPVCMKNRFLASQVSVV